MNNDKIRNTIFIYQNPSIRRTRSWPCDNHYSPFIVKITLIVSLYDVLRPDELEISLHLSIKIVI